MVHAPASDSLWQSVRSLPDFWRLLELRTASQFGDGLFQIALSFAVLEITGCTDDDGLAVGVVAGDHAANLECHIVSP